MAMTNAMNYKIDVFVDTICPWCYVGKRRLEIAIKQHQVDHPSDNFDVVWHAFQIDPAAPIPSIPKRQSLARKFGSERTRNMLTYMGNLGKQIGIDFTFEGNTGNSLDSHRMIMLGRSKGNDMHKSVMDQVLKAYFESDEDITRRDVLVACGVRAGLDEAEAREWLASDKGKAEFEEDMAHARKRWISGVPNFTINDMYEIQGAQEPSTFLQVFSEIKAAGPS